MYLSSNSTDSAAVDSLNSVQPGGKWYLANFGINWSEI